MSLSCTTLREGINQLPTDIRRKPIGFREPSCHETIREPPLSIQGSAFNRREMRCQARGVCMCMCMCVCVCIHAKGKSEMLGIPKSLFCLFNFKVELIADTVKQICRMQIGYTILTAVRLSHINVQISSASARFGRVVRPPCF